MKSKICRGKRCDNKRWVRGYYWSNDCDNSFIRVVKEDGVFINPEDYEVDEDTVCDSLPWRDEYKEDIFEGDIVIVSYVPEIIGKVYWDDIECKYEVISIGKQYSGQIYEIQEVREIIGNIYDNPELLNEEE